MVDVVDIEVAVVDVVDIGDAALSVGDVALVAVGWWATATVEAGPPLAASRLTPTPHPAAKAIRTRTVHAGTRRRGLPWLRPRVSTLSDLARFDMTFSTVYLPTDRRSTAASGISFRMVAPLWQRPGMRQFRGVHRSGRHRWTHRLTRLGPDQSPLSWRAPPARPGTPTRSPPPDAGRTQWRHRRRPPWRGPREPRRRDGRQPGHGDPRTAPQNR